MNIFHHFHSSAPIFTRDAPCVFHKHPFSCEWFFYTDFAKILTMNIPGIIRFLLKKIFTNLFNIVEKDRFLLKSCPEQFCFKIMLRFFTCVSYNPFCEDIWSVQKKRLVELSFRPKCHGRLHVLLVKNSRYEQGVDLSISFT